MTLPAEEQPFWSYTDLALFIGLSIPCLLMGAVIVNVAVWALHLNVRLMALKLLPAQFIGYGFLFLALYFILKLQYGRPFWRSMAWQPSHLRAGSAILMGTGLALGVALAGALLRTPDENTPLRQLLSEPKSLLLVAIFATTLGPVCEELAFRGFMQPLLVRSMGVLPGIVAQAIPFGVLHLQQNAWSWRHGLLIMLAGAAFGWVRHRAGSTRASALVHAAYNGTFFLLLFMQRNGR